MKSTMKNHNGNRRIALGLLFTGLFMFASQASALPSNCTSMLKSYFNAVANNDDLVPMLHMSSSSLWQKPPYGKAFTSHSENWGTVKNQTPNRYLEFSKGKQAFSDRNFFAGKKDEITFHVTEYGDIKHTLDSWGGGSGKLIVTGCYAMPDANNMVIQAVYGTSTRKAAYNLMLLTTAALY